MTKHEYALPNDLTIAVDKQGAGQPVLLLHGGGGTGTVLGFAGALAEHAQVFTPTHPGFDGRPRPEGTDTVADLAVAYLDLLDQLDLRDVVVIGSSVGGWLAAEIALRDNQRRVGGVVLLNAVGIPGEIADAANLTPAEFMALAWVKPPVLGGSPEQLAAAAANQQTLRVYAGDPYMHDPKLPARLHRVTVPVLVGWGEHDGVVKVEYGREYAGLFPNVHFELIPDAGHLPHIEQAARTLELIRKFMSELG